MSARQAVLPPRLEANTITRMKVGEYRYTVPWAMFVDPERRCWLTPGFPAEEHAWGTLEMRVGLREDGFHVWPPAQHRWRVEGRVRPGSLAVVELHEEGG